MGQVSVLHPPQPPKRTAQGRSVDADPVMGLRFAHTGASAPP